MSIDVAKHVFVVGGAALDITGAPTACFRLRDSNIGIVRISVGGVGHNIARSLKRHPLIDVDLITALGSDERVSMIEEDCSHLGISLAHCMHTEGATATYLSILDDEGDMLAGINDMQLITKLSPEFLETKLSMINAADMCVLDANLSPEALGYLAEHVTSPIFYEPVSCAKARRIGDHIGHCFAIKPNRYEAAQLSGCSCDTLRGVYRAAEWFLNEGATRVFISLGPEGVYWADAEGCGHIPAEPITVVDTTGAGDAMAAAIIMGCISGASTEACAQRGNHASALVCARKTEEDPNAI